MSLYSKRLKKKKKRLNWRQEYNPLTGKESNKLRFPSYAFKQSRNLVFTNGFTEYIHYFLVKPSYYSATQKDLLPSDFLSYPKYPSSYGGEAAREGKQEKHDPKIRLMLREKHLAVSSVQFRIQPQIPGNLEWPPPPAPADPCPPV